jgi:hypothetical protein
LELLEELGVAAELLCEEGALFRTELELLATIDPVEVLEHRPRILTCTLLRIYSTDGATLEVVRFMNIFMGREEVVHDHEMDLATMWKFDAMQTIETRE